MLLACEAENDGWLVPGCVPACNVYIDGKLMRNVVRANRRTKTIEANITDASGNLIIKDDEFETRMSSGESIEVGRAGRLRTEAGHRQATADRLQAGHDDA